jgi:anti-anti-sigma regulatory factor
VHRLLVYGSPQQDRSAVAVWIAEALGRGEKVLYKHAPTEDAAAVLGRSLPQVGLDADVLTSGRVELLDTAVVHADTDGRHERLYDLHREQLTHAAREGFTGLALTGDEAAMHTVTRDDTELAGYERDIERLAADSGVRSLCRYPAGERPALLADMLAVHHRAVEDNDWAAEMAGDRLRVRGEIDASNADRFATVLHAGVADGLRLVDLSGLRFCALAGVRAFASASASASLADPQHGVAPLALVEVNPGLVKLLTLTGFADNPGLQLIERSRRP